MSPVNLVSSSTIRFIPGFSRFPWWWSSMGSLSAGVTETGNLITDTGDSLVTDTGDKLAYEQ